MFSVRFRRVRVRRRNNFCLSCENPLSYTSHIRHKEYMDLGKCTGWPFHDLDPRSWLRDKVRIWQNMKRKGSASVAYWVGYVTLTFDLTHDLDLGCFKVKFRNSCTSRIVGLIELKWKGSELIWFWAYCMTLPFDHTHDLDLGVSRSES